MPWGAAVAAVSLYSASQQADAAKSAAGQQGAAAQKSIDEQKAEFAAQQANNAPFLATGTAANARLAGLLGIGGGGSNLYGSDTQNGTVSPTPNQELYANDPAYKKAWDTTMASLANTYGSAAKSHATADDLTRRLGEQGYTQDNANQYASQNGLSPNSAPGSAGGYGSLLKPFSASDLAADPVYNSGLQFGLNTGTGAINARALAGGSYDSGATLKALTQYGNDYGSTKAGDAYNRYNTNQSNIYNRLAGISGTGQTAVAQVNQAGTNMANNVSNDLTGIGNARAAGIVGGANAWGGAINNASGAFNNYNSNQTLQALLAKNNQNPNYGQTANYNPDYYAG